MLLMMLLTATTAWGTITGSGTSAFSGCTSLESIEIPASVTSIYPAAFASCTRLASVTIYAPELSEYGWHAFEKNASGRKIYVFNKSLATYKAQASEMAVNEDDIKAIAGISLKDAADNSALIAAANGNSLNVTLQGRTLWKDGDWNTLCLPFSTELTGDLADADIRALSSASLSGDGVLTLNFTAEGAVTSITAGVPYIVKWAGSEGQYVENPVFEGVTMSSTEAGSVTSTDGNVQFLGTYSPVTLEANDRSKLYLGAANKLYWPSKDKTIGSFRAYFELSDGVEAREFVLNFGDEEATGIVSIDNGQLTIDNWAAAAWYDMQGRKLDGKPTAKGLYIHNGKKVVIK